MKKLISLMLTVLLVLPVLAGCVSDNNSSEPESSAGAEQSKNAESSVTEEESVTPEESVNPDESAPDESAPEESVPEESVPEESVPEESSKDPEISEDDTVKNSTNVALNKPYTRSVLYPDDGSPSYPDEGNKTATDGVLTPDGAKYSHASFMGFNKSHKDYTSRGYAHITVDLGGIYSVDKFIAYVGSAYYDGVGINAPQYVDIMVSHDNVNWYKAGRTVITDTDETNVIAATLTIDSPLTAKYVQYRFVGHSNWIFVCEVEAYGVEADKEVLYPEQAQEQTYLFVGNSATYFFDIPTKFMYIAESVGMSVNVSYCTVGGAYLSQFADASTDHGKALRSQLEANKFDYIVLQDNGNCDYNDTKPAMDKLVPMLRETGATLYLYQRYSSNSDPAKRLDSAYKHEVNYRQLAEDFNIPLVAQGADAFLICSEKYPELVIYHTDNSHHSDLGAYLLACVLAVTYLDIDLDDVTYTAGYDAATVAKIKECARIACEQGYAYPQDK